jgi:flagellar P-ring protein precursor FlgI
MVTVDLPPFARPGQRLDVQVSSIGDAKSLQGGTLLMTPLQGPDGQIYALAQGAVSIGGAFLKGGRGNSSQKNHPTTGRIPSGAIVELEVPTGFEAAHRFRLLLRSPDFATASRLAESVNAALGQPAARAEDAVSILVDVPEGLGSDPVTLLARIEAIEIRPDTTARVVINEKTGTVVMGDDVRVSTVAVAHGNLSVEVRTFFEASQPAPFSEKGRTVIVPEREVLTNEEPDKILTLEEGVTVKELVEALNALGVSARDMIAILQAMRAAGALHAEIVTL